jgi:Na+/H+-dicarboxylate symporter
MAHGLTRWIFVALLFGLGAGFAAHLLLPAQEAKAFADLLSITTAVFLRLIKMVIAPLVLASLVAGIGHMGEDVRALGRIGTRSLAWFIAASLLSITIGIIAVNWLQPGSGLDLPLPPAAAGSGAERQGFDLRPFVTHLVPASIFAALAENEILQIVVFAVFAGTALATMGERGAPLLQGAEALMQLMLIITRYVMLVAPVAVFAAVAGTIAERGIGVVLTYGVFMGSFYVALALLMAAVLGAGALVVGGRDALRLARELRAPLLLAFSTASSEAAYPRTLEALDRYGAPRRISSFVLPLGYSFNLDGSMMYCSFATLFIAQAYGIDLSISDQLVMLLLLMVTSKGIAGVPRASLVVISATLGHFGIPEAGLVLILAVDHFLDMGRSATNVVGNAVATAVVARWEERAATRN